MSRYARCSAVAWVLRRSCGAALSVYARGYCHKGGWW